MVTFALPGDTDAAPAVNGTPRARPPLPFANRANGGTPFSSRSSRQLGTPQQSSSRKLLMTRDEMPASSLSRSSMAAARNIFRASSVADSPPPNNVPFSPMLPQSTMKKVFAPGATPEPSRVYRESTAHATPRGMAAKAVEKDLFPMRISSPPRELTGEVLAQKVPKEWNSKGSIYADQFLAHLCPPELDEEQRRQFFCILDLRRLKYAANEIFSKKDWKLNVVNFAKEFEKSRSIILLRYGLYEFQNVKPSKEVLKRWRREHGLPEPEEEEESTPTPTQPAASKKRKADTDLSKTSAATTTESTAGKRRATEQPTVEEPVAIPATSKVLGKNKRRASMDEEAETPNKQPKPAPSAAKSLFEKIANKPATSTESPKPVLFNANKPAAGGLARSVFENLKTGSSQPPSTTSDNIFGYLSDTNSARNSGVEADAESDSESDEDEEEEEEESEQTNKSASETSAATPSLTNGAAITSAASLFAPKPSTTSGEDSSAPATRESTPGRSIFDRVTKGNDGQPVRASDAESAAGKASPVADQTWNPATTPLKFAPTSAGSATSLFGKPAASTATSSIFGSAPSPAANLFGSSNAQPSKEATSASESAKDGESDKENESLQIKAPAAEAKPAAPAHAAQSLFQPKPTEAAPAPSTSLFGSASKPTTTNLFGAASKPSEAAPAASVSTLFGAKPAEPEKSGSATPVPTFSFGQKSDAAPAATTTATTSTSLFGAAPATTKPLFGAAPQAPKTDTAPAVATPTFSFGAGATSTATKPDVAPAPAFSFGAASGTAASKPLFGAPKSPEATSTAGNMFGSPMKQDDQSPAKKMFTGSANAGSATPTFSFGANTSTAPSAAPIFGGATSQPANSAVSFGSATTNAGNSFGFNFGAEANGNSSFNNPFASGSNGANGATQSSAPAGGFSFTAGSTPSTTPNTSFQFGANPAQSGGSMFGGNTGGSNTPMFGGAPSSGAAPAFSFGAGSGQAPAGGNMFGSNQAAPAFGNSLQPPVGGSSTAGTNSPLNLPGGSSLATTPAAGTPEPSAKADGATAAGDDDETEKHEQINLTDGSEEDEEIMHEIRAKVLKFTKADKEDGEDKPKSPWATMGVGPLRVLKHKETNGVRLLLRAEPRGHIAINRSLLPDFTYKADEKYVRLTTANESGDSLETWMVQVKTKDLAKALAEALEENKVHNKKDE